jgi:toxin ParE1/3/4
VAEVKWTSNALSDLNQIGEHIAKDSPYYAHITVQRVFVSAEILRTFPELGRIVPEKAEETVRELIEGNYRVIYEYQQDTCWILTVHHSAKPLK